MGAVDASLACFCDDGASSDCVTAALRRRLEERKRPLGRWAVGPFERLAVGPRAEARGAGRVPRGHHRPSDHRPSGVRHLASGVRRPAPGAPRRGVSRCSTVMIACHAMSCVRYANGRRASTRRVASPRSAYLRASATLHHIALHRIALHCIASHRIASHCIELHCIVLYYTALRCIALHNMT